MEQLSIYDLDYTTLKDGRIIPAPGWINKKRCENCVLWERTQEQGFSIKGFCRNLHEKQDKYQKTNKTDYCQGFKPYGA